MSIKTWTSCNNKGFWHKKFVRTNHAVSPIGAWILTQGRQFFGTLTSPTSSWCADIPNKVTFIAQTTHLLSYYSCTTSNMSLNLVTIYVCICLFPIYLLKNVNTDMFCIICWYILKQQLMHTHSSINTYLDEINNLRYEDDTTLMAKSEEELKGLLKKLKRSVKKLV